MKQKLNPFHRIVTLHSFFKIIKTTPENFKNFLDCMDLNETERLKVMIDQIYECTKFNRVDFYDKDWYGRTHMRITINCANGILEWPVIGSYELFQFVELYSMGIYKCTFNFHQLRKMLSKI